MKATEAAALLTIAAAYDNRKPDVDQAKAWALILDGLRFEDCRDVIVAHYQRSKEWLMPVDVIGGVKRLRSKRIHDHGPVVPPSWMDPDDPAALIRWQRETDEAIADGTYVAPAVQAIDGPKRDVRELGQAQSINTALAAKPLRAAHAEAVHKKQAAEVAAKEERREKQQRLEDMRAADRAARETKADPSKERADA